MGNESSAYDDVSLGDSYDVGSENAWKLHSAQGKGGENVSVFVYKKDKKYADCAVNAAKQLKVLRHPCLLRFLWWKEAPDGHLIVTECVKPLLAVLDDLTPGEVCAGLHNVLEALIFLHDMGGSSHNNLSLASVFVSEDGGWRLGGLDHCCAFTAAARVLPQRPARAAPPPEEKAGTVDSSAAGGAARDAFAFGVMAEQLLEQLADLGDMTKTFQLRVQDEFLSPDPSARPRLRDVLDDRLFRNDFVEITTFLKQVTLKSEEEKKLFFSGLAGRLRGLPVELVAARLVRPLLARFVLLDPTADACLVPHLLTPYSGTERPAEGSEGVTPLLPEALFRKHVVAELYKIFHVRDAHVRKVLLRHFPAYVGQFERQVLRTVILPQVLLGLRDADDALVALSLHCLGDLVTELGAGPVIGAQRSRLFSTALPKFGGREGEVAKRRDSPTAQPSAPHNSTEGKTLKALAREAERQKRRSEARQRAEERQRRREEAKAIRAAEKAVEPDTVNISIQGPEECDSDREVQETEEEEEGEEGWQGWGGDSEAELAETSSPEALPPEPYSTDTRSALSGDARPGDDMPHADRADSPVHVDWSDATAAPREGRSPRRGILKLKTRTSPPPHQAAESHSELTDLDSRTSPNRKSPSRKSPSRKHIVREDRSQEKTAAPPKQPDKPARKPQPLGAEFDIMAIDIKTSKHVVNTEPDFFADMAPVIKSEDSLMSLLRGAQDQPALSFAVQDQDQPGAEGWGDDFGDDWGDS